jgi:hypothetical protein
MAGIAYKRLFNLPVKHNFYVDNLSKKDLVFVPTASTALVMKNANMLFRNDESGFRVLYKTDGSAAAFISFTNARLVFSMQLINPTEFLNVTELLNYTSSKILYFTNRGSITTSALNYSLIDYLRPASFTYTFPQTATGITDLGSIVITDQAGNIVTPAFPSPISIKPNAANQYEYPIDFSLLPRGLYTFTTSSSVGASTKKIYIDTELAKQGTFGIVDIVATDDAVGSYPASREYTVNFLRRTTQWKYIVVLKSVAVTATPTPTIKIQDDGVATPEYPIISFNASTDTTVNGLPAKIITSTINTIPYYQLPKKGLTIIKDEGLTSEQIVLTDTPGPPIGIVSAQANNFNITEIFITI